LVDEAEDSDGKREISERSETFELESKGVNESDGFAGFVEVLSSLRALQFAECLYGHLISHCNYATNFRGGSWIYGFNITLDEHAIGTPKSSAI
jgi:hypothetical protein